MKIDQWYSEALTAILTEGSKEVNKRTGMEVSALPGLTFQTDLEKYGLPLLALRRIPVKNFVAEQCWFLSGSSRVADLEPYTKIWSAFADDNGSVSSAYGRRWRKWKANNGIYVDQLHTVLDKLRRDPTSRHGVVMMWDPRSDLLVPQKNVPCPYTFTLMIIGGRLHLHLTVRSNDMVLGFPTDAAGFAWLQMVLAQQLNVTPGIYTHSISNAHIYANHYDAAATMVFRNRDKMAEPVYFPTIKFELPNIAYYKAQAMDAPSIAEFIAQIEEKYQPLDPIKGLTIAL